MTRRPRRSVRAHRGRRGAPPAGAARPAGRAGAAAAGAGGRQTRPAARRPRSRARRRPRVSGPGPPRARSPSPNAWPACWTRPTRRPSDSRTTTSRSSTCSLALIQEGPATGGGRLLREHGVTRDASCSALTQVRGNQRVTSAMPEAAYEALEKYGRISSPRPRPAGLTRSSAGTARSAGCADPVPQNQEQPGPHR